LVNLRKKLVTLTGNPVQLYVRSKSEVVVTESGYTSFEKLQGKFLKKAKTLYQKEIEEFVKGGL
jgi:hypothetical protein